MGSSDPRGGRDARATTQICTAVGRDDGRSPGPQPGEPTRYRWGVPLVLLGLSLACGGLTSCSGCERATDPPPIPDAAPSRATDERRRDQEAITHRSLMGMLDSLRASQQEDGGWGDPATTGAVLIAFSSCGETEKAGGFQRTVSRGLKYLEASQLPSGSLVSESGETALRDHAVAGLALAQSQSIEPSAQREDCVARALGFAKRVRTDGGGWPARAGEAVASIEASAWMTRFCESAASVLDEAAALHADDFAMLWAAIEPLADTDTWQVRDTGSASACDVGELGAMMLYVRAVCARAQGTERLAEVAANSRLQGVLGEDGASPLSRYFLAEAMFVLRGPRFADWVATMAEATQRPPDGTRALERQGSTPSRAHVWETALHVQLCSNFFGRVAHAWPQDSWR